MVAYVPPKQAGKYKAVASGAITNGKPVIVNTDGTVGMGRRVLGYKVESQADALRGITEGLFTSKQTTNTG